MYFTTAYFCVSRANNVKNQKKKKNAHYIEAKEQELLKSILNIFAEFANFTK